MPRRGDVRMVDLGIAAKVRPALALSVAPDDAGRVLVTWVIHTTELRGSVFEVVLPVSLLRAGAFNVQNLVTTTRRDAGRYLGTLTPDQLAAVEDGVRRWLGL